MTSGLDVATVVQVLAILGCGLMAGVFFAFSTFIIKALARLPAETGIAAMQSINVAAVKSWFLGAFLGTSAACGLVIVSACMQGGEPCAKFLLAGGSVFLLGTFLVTVVFHVPLNHSLAALRANGPDGAAQWARYVADWTRWNHLRTVASMAAAALLMASWAGDRKRPAPTPAMDQRPATRRTAENEPPGGGRTIVLTDTTFVPLIVEWRLGGFPVVKILSLHFGQKRVRFDESFARWPRGAVLPKRDRSGQSRFENVLNCPTRSL